MEWSLYFKITLNFSDPKKDPFRAIRRELKEKEGNYRAPTAKMSQAKSALVIFNLSGVFRLLVILATTLLKQKINS